MATDKRSAPGANEPDPRDATGLTSTAAVHIDTRALSRRFLPSLDLIDATEKELAALSEDDRKQLLAA